ncbi:MAG: helix-turn-helix transcriptional regulator [Thalassovita sp.]
MYDPKGNGKDRTVQAVSFVEVEPPAALQGIVHRFLDLKTTEPLSEAYRFHALPDACVYLVFDQLSPEIAGVAQLRAESEEFNLGRAFHYVNIRFLPGVWQSPKSEITLGAVSAPYTGDLGLTELNQTLAQKTFADQVPVLSEFVAGLVDHGHVALNPITSRIFQHLEDIQTVADMAEIAGLSARQLQRRLKQSTGFAPHDFLKILRLQQSLNGNDTWSYADQSHFIHSFRKATGYTPGRYSRKFDV